ncbi:MAG: GDSL-type esterase/lipase family protein [Acidobacteriota bacterium]|nr:GDSL-type esterase/lipase family protein [Acidobacteriota bacterium]
MRRLLYWYVPLGAALIAAAVFAHGFYSFARGDTGTSVGVTAPSRVAAAPPSSTIVPVILGDSLARGTGDESGLGIGGRLVDELRRRKIDTKNIVNLAINGSRTADLLQQMESHNVQVVLAEANVVIVSIGGNDLWGDNWRNAPPRDPQAVIGGVIDHIARIVDRVRTVNPHARIYIIGLYNPFASMPYARVLSSLVNDWNAKLVERFAKDSNLVVVQTSDLFAWRDRLSMDRFHPAAEGYALIARRIADTF